MYLIANATSNLMSSFTRSCVSLLMFFQSDLGHHNNYHCKFQPYK
jgi:hypothetical protein